MAKKPHQDFGHELPTPSSTRKRKKMKFVGWGSSRFAAVIPQNLKLVYLRRSLVLEILKQGNDAAELESKIVGSFVRMKTDHKDCLYKHSHHLLQVTGLKVDSASEDENSKVLLRASAVIKDIPVGTLSDDDFTEEECDELRQKIKDSVLEKLTVEALQHKTNILHKDMITHWLPRELAILQNQFNRALENGSIKWFECRERLDLLESKKEQSRLLAEIPKVKAEEIEPQEVIKIEDDTPERVEMIKAKEVIEIGSDTPGREIEQNLTEVRNAEPAVYSLTQDMWHYVDPLGKIQGPYSMALLKAWSEGCYFPQDFRVWRTGQSRDEAVFLAEILSWKLPNGSARAKAP